MGAQIDVIVRAVGAVFMALNAMFFHRLVQWYVPMTNREPPSGFAIASMRIAAGLLAISLAVSIVYTLRAGSS